MARYASSQGKGPKKKKRDKDNRASITIESQTTKHNGREIEYVRKTKRNDGDPHVYYHRRTTTPSGHSKKITKTKDPKAANPNPGLKGFRIDLPDRT